MSAALARHDALIEGLVARNGGRVVRPRGEGDSRFAVFRRASDAVSAACSIQLALVGEQWPLPEPLRVRIAIHTGEGELRQADYYGPAVNHCARLRAAAHGGQVLVSTLTADLVREGLTQLALLDLGEYRLKDLERPEHIWQLVHPDLPADFPPLNLQLPISHNLPHRTSTFVGREGALDELRGLLVTQRLLTLTGTGGVGKTRLALELAERQQADFSAGACFVDLAPIADEALVAHSILAGVGLRAERERAPIDTLIERVRRSQLLLVLDNCEHVLSSAATVAETLLRGCPELRILATSREPLGIAGESVRAVPALKLPVRRRDASVEGVLASEAGRLFVERATGADSSFTLRPDTAPAVAEICWQLDGIPLALELAAVRVRGLTVAQIAARLGDRFRLLSGGTRAGPPRHQTLRAAVDWSYELLSDAERTLFNRLSVFAGGWTLEAAEAVCSGGAPRADENDVVPLLTQLVDRGLVLADQRSDAMRYRMYETLRQYAAERLASSGEEARLRDAHRDWCLRVAEEGERDIWRADQLLCVARLERERENVRLALRWTLTRLDDPEPGLRIAAAMVRFWDVHGELREGIRWLNDLLALPSVRAGTVGWARALTARAYLTIIGGDGERAIALLDETLPFWRGLGDPRGLAMALFFRGFAIAWGATDIRKAVPTFIESLTLARQRGPRWTTYFCLFCLGESARLDGDTVRADTLLSESLALSTEAGDRWGAFYALYALARLALERGDHRAGTSLAQRSLNLCIELGDVRGVTYALDVLGCIAAAEGEARHAGRLFGAAQALRQPVGEFMSANHHVALEAALTRIRSQLGPRGSDSALAAGRNLTLDQAVDEARGVLVDS